MHHNLLATRSLCAWKKIHVPIVTNSISLRLQIRRSKLSKATRRINGRDRTYLQRKSAGHCFLHDAAKDSEQIVLPVQTNPWLSPGSASNEVNEQTEVFSRHRMKIITTVALQSFLHHKA